MHELSIAEELIDQIIEVAQKKNIINIDEVEIETGVLRQVVPDVMQEAFKTVSQNTLADGALLKITEVKAVAICRQCNRSFGPKINNFLCPICDRSDVDITKGDSIILKSISCYEEEGKINDEGKYCKKRIKG